MRENKKKSLLPQGLSDILPDVAIHEAMVIDKLLSNFRSYGYDRVQPPLIEFEESLFNGTGAAMAAHTFRLMDPISQKMMGLRADMTPQIARIAATRLQNTSRPLRLSYAGQVLRVKGNQLRPERQFTQVGAELIGSSYVEADSEIISMAVIALQNLQIKNISVDISLPTIVPSIIYGLGLNDQQSVVIRQALDQKDASAIAKMGGNIASQFGILLKASGRVEIAIAAFKDICLPIKAQQEYNRLLSVLDILKIKIPNVIITLDMVEHRGFEYQTGLSFTLFAAGIRGELGRGGRYNLNESNEAAIGVSLYLDSILRAAPATKKPNKLFIPFNTHMEFAIDKRKEGWITISGLENITDIKDIENQARSLNCTHILIENNISILK